MPRIVRPMRVDNNSLPLVGSRSKCLGVREPPSGNADVDLDDAGNVVLTRIDTMKTFAPKIDFAYLEYANRLLQQHRLLADGNESSDETIAVEDEMTKLWEHLDSIQHKSLAGLSSDLNWVRRGGVPAPLGPRADDVSQESLLALDEATRASDWHRLLHLLRVCAPTFRTFDLARFRAETWSKLGQPLIASVFNEFCRLALPATSHSSRSDGSTGG
jgi:hypothetical protein